MAVLRMAPRWNAFLLKERSAVDCWGATFALALLLGLLDAGVRAGRYSMCLVFFNIITILFGALRGGVLPGCFLGIWCALFLDYFQFEPVGIILSDAADALSLFLFLALSALIGIVAASAKESLNRAYRAQLAEARAVRQRESILGLVCHEIRNPLQIIDLGNKLLKDAVEKGNFEMVPEWLEKMEAAGLRITRLTQDLTDVAKADEGQFRLRKKNAVVSDTIQQGIDSVLLDADARNIRIEFSHHGGREEAFLDHDRILQIVQNLLANAIKFSPAGSVVSVRLTMRPASVDVEVSDSGVGIPANELEHVFDWRWQAHLGKAGEGSGLGLYISKALVSAHGGAISVASAPEKGSVFRFTLPRLVAGTGIPKAPSRSLRPDSSLGS
jgi:signal transduction histidine kinase